MPSPLEDRPGLMVRDPFHYSDSTLIIPPPLVPLLGMFDGEQTEDELKRALLEMTGDLRAGDLMEHLRDALHNAGFLRDEKFEQMKEDKQKQFAESPCREAAHAGGAYPDEASELTHWLIRQGVSPAGASGDGLLGIAAPHVSPDGGWDSYRAAYRALDESKKARTFVVLGTSHYGEPESFGLTRKPFRTPFGDTRADEDLVNWLGSKAPRATRMEDYCHAVEHSIEFQVVMLQSLFGADVRVLPVLCGPFAKSLYTGGMPEDDDGVREFIDALGELNVREGKRLCWVLGVDMAHIGRRYGDREAAEAHTGVMLEVAARDKERIGRLAEGDARGFWDMVQPNHDDLKWCGSAPLYTFFKAVPVARGQLLHYEHWNIDAQSVVSFGALALRG